MKGSEEQPGSLYRSICTPVGVTRGPTDCETTISEAVETVDADVTIGLLRVLPWFS